MSAKDELRKLLINRIGEASICAKWMDRQGKVAKELMNHLRLYPKQYRRLIVDLSKTVETQMSAKQWDDINFSHVPSQASRIYRKAFNRHTPKYQEYVNALASGDKTVKVNASATYPYEVIKEINSLGRSVDNLTSTELNHIAAQWDALPNYIGDKNILPMVDVSGSMTCKAGKSTNVTCLDIAVSLGLYLADKNKGKFNGNFLTFSNSPQLMYLTGNIVQKCAQMKSSDWGMNTNIDAAFDLILNTAKQFNLPQEEMPEAVVIMSDMNIDRCTMVGVTGLDMIRKKFENSNYKMPSVIFWNINSQDHVPARQNDIGVALIAGFSPAIMKSVLSMNFDDITPYGIMMKTIMNPKYDLT